VLFIDDFQVPSAVRVVDPPTLSRGALPWTMAVEEGVDAGSARAAPSRRLSAFPAIW